MMSEDQHGSAEYGGEHCNYSYIWKAGDGRGFISEQPA